ncbi:hypothetical protein GGF46_003318 [Coemansia sp. RSA 552]|nr:hypothetical protein GGF46_003318 [Coemansia sp. RSA 552]
MEVEPPTRDEVLQLILCQLSEYGFANLSQAIATHTNVPMTTDSNSRLAELVRLGLQSEKQTGGGSVREADEVSEEADDGGIDLSKSAQRDVVARAPHYRVWYKTRHKGVATAAAFSRDGRYIATGSADMSLKLIDVDKVRSPLSGSARREDKPVIRTLYHHDSEITGMAFHPNGLVLASCSADRTVKLFDISAAYGKHSFQSFRDNFVYRSITFHPSGEFLAAGGDGHEVRLYNVRTAKAYLLSAGNGPGLGQHSAGVTQVAYANSGSLIASSSCDGSVKIWDGVSGKCVRSIDRAHSGQAVTAVAFSRSGSYVLTTGLDSVVGLWETGSGRLMQSYSGAGLDGMDAQAVFSHDEALVLAPDAKTNSVAVWDAASGRLLGKGAEHKQRITRIAASPVSPAFMSCSVDECVRYWSADST